MRYEPHKGPYATRLLLVASVAALLSLTGCGEGSSDSGEADSGDDQVSAEPAGEQEPAAESSSSQSQTIEGSDSGSVIQQSSSSSSTQQSIQQSSADGGITMLSGSGRSELELSVSRPSRLSWTNTEGDPFSLEAGEGELSISSRAGRGEVDLDPGDYSDVEVEGDLWTVVVRPR